MSDDKAHWQRPPDRPTSLAGRFYRAWGEAKVSYATQTYELLSHHDCGYHLVNVADSSDRRCVSERAIDRTYHEMREVSFEDMQYRESDAAAEARRKIAEFKKARVYFCGGAYHVVPIQEAAK